MRLCRVRSERLVARALETLAESESTAADENGRHKAVQDTLEFASSTDSRSENGFAFET